MVHEIVRRICFSLLVCSSAQLISISIVYNFRVSEITRRLVFNLQNTAVSNITFLEFGQSNLKYDTTKERAAGLLGTYLYQHKHLYAELDGAFGYVSSTLNGSKFSRVQTDDLLFTGWLW